MKNNTNRITFREARSAEELERLLKLRYEVFSESRLAGMLSDGSAESEGLDIDQFDPYSHHFGMFAEVQGIEKEIGYLRIATRELQAQDSPIVSLTQEIGLPAVNHPECKYPMQTHAGSPEITQFLATNTRDGSRLVEPSRLSIKSDWRSIKTSVFLLECSIAWSLKEQYELAWLCCANSQERAYRRYGFKAIPECEVFVDERCSMKAARMYLKPEFIPVYRRGRLDAMAQEMATEGFITLRNKKSACTNIHTTANQEPQINKSKVA